MKAARMSKKGTRLSPLRYRISFFDLDQMRCKDGEGRYLDALVHRIDFHQEYLCMCVIGYEICQQRGFVDSLMTGSRRLASQKDYTPYRSIEL